MVTQTGNGSSGSRSHKYILYITLFLQCSLGVQFFNPNVAGEMAQLMISNQENYVPTFETRGQNIVLKTVQFHGDQLFEERARNTKWVYQDGQVRETGNRICRLACQVQPVYGLHNSNSQCQLLIIYYCYICWFNTKNFQKFRLQDK